MNDFVLPSGIEHVPDLVVIGTQESCPERFEWEVILQETLGPSHVLFHSTALGTLHLCAFIRRDLIWFCSVPEDACFSVRAATAFRTKGKSYFELYHVSSFKYIWFSTIFYRSGRHILLFIRYVHALRDIPFDSASAKGQGACERCQTNHPCTRFAKKSEHSQQKQRRDTEF